MDPKKKSFALPAGGKLIKPVSKKLGGYSELVYDAKVIRYGITWFRLKDGFGGKGDRENWVGDVPSVCLSVHDYQWREPRWGFIVANSFDEAIAIEIKNSLGSLRHKQKSLRTAIKESEEAEFMIVASIALISK